MAAEFYSFLWMGLVLGTQAGLAPGPVSTLIVTESLCHGRRAGMKIAFVPFLTDVPVICVIIPLLYYLTFDATVLIGAISMVGALILCYLGYESLTVTRNRFERGNAPRVSLPKAIAANFFNPNLYIYWIAICGPLCVRALRNDGLPSMFLFLTAFYGSLTLSKLGVALAIGSARQWLNLNVIVWLNRLLGVAMFLFAAMFFWQGFQLFGGETSIRSGNTDS